MENGEKIPLSILIINIIKNYLLDILEFHQNLDADLDFDLKDSDYYKKIKNYSNNLEKRRKNITILNKQ